MTRSLVTNIRKEEEPTLAPGDVKRSDDGSPRALCVGIQPVTVQIIAAEGDVVCWEGAAGLAPRERVVFDTVRCVFLPAPDPARSLGMVVEVLPGDLVRVRLWHKGALGGAKVKKVPIAAKEPLSRAPTSDDAERNFDELEELLR